jgi:hypothetical protein
LLALLSSVRASSPEIERVVFEDRVRVHDVPLVVHVGLIRWKIVLRGM